MKAEPALTPAIVYTRPVSPHFSDHIRRWQGIPSIEVSPKGTVFVNFYGGDTAEEGGNYVILCASTDQGNSFASGITIVEHPDRSCRLYDPCLWFDPLGRLWMFWAQTRAANDGRNGVWAIVCDDAEQSELTWSAPRRIANGIMLNKPIVSAQGEWLFPCALWRDECGSPPSERHGLEHEQFSNVYVSTDQGKNFSLRGHADIPNRSFDEHMIVQRKDASLWMLVRTFDGIGESFSYDGGVTWTTGQKSHMQGPCSRFFIARLKSGRLLMINHYNSAAEIDIDALMQQGHVKNWNGRNNLTAMLSEDDGQTWPYTLLLDERDSAAYPDAKEGADGYLYITYDYERVTHREILMARITEQDILDGKISSSDGALRMLVNRATGQLDVDK